jgi:hypothetical protein
MQGATVHPGVESRINNLRTNSLRIPHKPVLSTLPRITLLTFKVALHRLVESRVIARQQPLIFGWKNDFDGFLARRHFRAESEEYAKQGEQDPQISFPIYFDPR